MVVARTPVGPGLQLAARFHADPFWSEGQQAAFLASCWAVGAQPGPRQADAWRRGKGGPFRHWRSLSKRRGRLGLVAAWERAGGSLPKREVA